MLILFDIDGTLLLSRGAGVKAMTDAGRELFGDSFEFNVDCAGLLDPIIWSMLAEHNGIDDADGHHDAFRATYAKHLQQRFEADPSAELLPGVVELIERLQAEDGVTLGLLTGNYPETGRLKISTAGLDPDLFPIAAWGDEAEHRRGLPSIAMARYEQMTGTAVDSGQVVVIGDTPHDIDCARAGGCRVLGVASGPTYSLEDLAVCEPDLTLTDLTDTEAVLGWMLEIRATAFKEERA